MRVSGLASAFRVDQRRVWACWKAHSMPHTAALQPQASSEFFAKSRNTRRRRVAASHTEIAGHISHEVMIAYTRLKVC